MVLAITSSHGEGADRQAMPNTNEVARSRPNSQPSRLSSAQYSINRALDRRAALRSGATAEATRACPQPGQNCVSLRTLLWHAGHCWPASGTRGAQRQRGFDPLDQERDDDDLHQHAPRLPGELPAQVPDGVVPSADGSRIHRGLIHSLQLHERRIGGALGDEEKGDPAEHEDHREDLDGAGRGLQVLLELVVLRGRHRLAAFAAEPIVGLRDGAARRAFDRRLAGLDHQVPVDPQADTGDSYELRLDREHRAPAVRQRERNRSLGPHLAGVVNFACVDGDDLLAEASEVRLYGVRLIHFPCLIHRDLPYLPICAVGFLLPSAAAPPCYAFSFHCPQLWQPLRQEAPVDANPNIYAARRARDWLWR